MVSDQEHEPVLVTGNNLGEDKVITYTVLHDTHILVFLCRGWTRKLSVDKKAPPILPYLLPTVTVGRWPTPVPTNMLLDVVKVNLFTCVEVGMFSNSMLYLQMSTVVLLVRGFPQMRQTLALSSRLLPPNH